MPDTSYTRKDAVLYGGAAVGGFVVAGAAVTAVAKKAGDKSTPVEGAPIVARFVDGDLPVTDPGSDTWDKADAALVPLAPQQLVQPYLETAGVGSLDAKALSNGSQLALLLEWSDESVDDLDGIRRYHDAVAAQLPTRAGNPPALTMGSPGTPVHILQWRATWQRDIDSGGKTGVDQI